MKTITRSAHIVSLVTTLLIAFGTGSIWANPLFSFQNPAFQATSSSPTNDTKAKKPKKEKKAKGKKGGGVTFHEGSGETRAERDKRLTRECKGRSNSGMCEGYTR